MSADLCRTCGQPKKLIGPRCECGEPSGPRSLGVAVGSAMNWRPGSEHPPFGTVCLCRGESYDAGSHNGYLLAYVVDGQWVTGKQQYEVTIHEWTALPNTTMSQPGGQS